MAADTAIPRVTETDIDRADLEQAARELDIENHEALGDQELFEAVGRRLGEIDDEDAPEAVRTRRARAGGNGQAAAGPTGRRLGQGGATATAQGAPDGGEGSAGAGEATADEATADEATADEATADEVTADRKQARDRGEYRVEDDERNAVRPILDLELGPLALDLLGLDVHLNRVHAVILANPGPKHALLGKLLSGVAVAADRIGLGPVTDTLTDGVEAVVDALPTPDTGIDDGPQRDGGGHRGIVRRLGSAAGGAARSAVDILRPGA